MLLGLFSVLFYCCNDISKIFFWFPLSAFLSPDEQEDNRAVYQATNYLWHDVIPRFARWLFNDDDGNSLISTTPSKLKKHSE